MTALSVASEARTRVDRIKTGVEVVWTLIVESYQSRDWEALGYATWDEMCTREFGTSRLRLPREERAETVQSLREAGLSLRAISSATGDSYGTVRNALSGEQFCSPDSDTPETAEPDGFAEKIAAELAASDDEYADRAQAVVDTRTGEVVEPGDEPLTEAECEALDQANRPEPAPKVTGLDGKKHPRTKPPGRSRQRALIDEFRPAITELDSKVKRITKLAGDARFSSNAGQISQKYLSDLTRARDALQCVIDQLP